MFEQYIDLCEMQNINLKKNDIEKVVKIMFKYLNENLNCLNKKYWRCLLKFKNSNGFKCPEDHQMIIYY
jgi:hypothetical protein